MGVVGLLYLMCMTMCRGRAVYDYLTELRAPIVAGTLPLLEQVRPLGRSGNIARYYEADARLHPGRLDSGGAADSGHAAAGQARQAVE